MRFSPLLGGRFGLQGYFFLLSTNPCGGHLLTAEQETLSPRALHPPERDHRSPEARVALSISLVAQRPFANVNRSSLTVSVFPPGSQNNFYLAMLPTREVTGTFEIISRSWSCKNVGLQQSSQAVRRGWRPR